MLKNLAALSVFATTLFAQPRVSLENQGTHVMCVVSMIGTGTPQDPRRPMFTPQSLIAPPAQLASTSPAPVPGQPVILIPSPPIVSMQYQVSDDGKFALVDFAGSNIGGVQPILNSTDPNVKVCFLRDSSTKAQIETAFQQYKATFSLDTMVPVLAAKTAQAAAQAVGK